MDTDITKVIFRVWTRKDFRGTVSAFFPEYPGTNDPATCAGYEHYGQHFSTDYRSLLGVTRPAQPNEYAALKAELESMGYSLQVAQHETRADYEKREAQLRGIK